MHNPSERILPEDIHHLSTPELLSLVHDWDLWARPEQLPPHNPNSTHYSASRAVNWQIWLALAGRGWGKQLPLDTPIPTTRGWKTVGTLSSDDVLFDESGLPTHILQIHPISIPESSYRIHFNDGTSIDACSEHLWVTWPHSALKSYARDTSPGEFPPNWPIWKKSRSKNFASRQAQSETLTTQKIFQTQHRISHGKPVANHGIPCTLPLQLPHRPLPIDPYLLGYWLGNGSSRSSVICCHSQDIEWLLNHIPDSQRTKIKDPQPNRAHFKVPSLTPFLIQLNLIGNKHIPPDYLRASIEQRLSLVRGFMDADGHIPFDRDVRHAEIAQVRHQLADQLKELLHSLGFYVTESIKTPTIDGVSKNPVKLLKFTPREGMNPFQLPRKASRVIDPPTQRLRTRYRRITLVEPITPVPMRCITVDSPYAMYLAGTQMVPTHNTRMGAETVLDAVTLGYRRIAIIAPTTADTRDVVTEGESGILSVAHPSARPTYEPSKRRLTFPNGAIATLFSAEEPERLRGPQFDFAWLDEIAAWQYPQETWDMLQFGLRLGTHPRTVISTTPKPIPLIRSLIERSKKTPDEVIISTGSTYENRANLAKTFFGQVAQYEGTRLGRQELYAELIDPTESAIIHRSWLTSQLFPASADLPDFEHILQSYDTAFTEDSYDRKTKDPDPSASSTWGVFRLTNKVKTQLNLPLSTPYEYAVLLLDAWSDYLGYPELRTRIKKEYDTSYYNERRTDTVLIENKGSGISLRQDLQRNVPVRPYNPGRSDKIERLHAVSHLPCNGLVLIPESRTKPGKPCTWAEPFLEQLCTFPLVDHDDYVDTFSQAMAYLRDVGYLCIDTSDPDDLDNYVQTRRRGNPYGR